MQIKLVADVFVRAEGKALLVRYAHPDRYDGEAGWFLPDDFLRHGEHPSDAALRILRDQVGIADGTVVLDHIESMDGDDWHLIFHFRADRERANVPNASADVRDARWFALDALPDRAAVAHDGWALDLIGTMTSRT